MLQTIADWPPQSVASVLIGRLSQLASVLTGRLIHLASVLIGWLSAGQCFDWSVESSDQCFDWSTESSDQCFDWSVDSLGQSCYIVSVVPHFVVFCAILSRSLPTTTIFSATYLSVCA